MEPTPSKGPAKKIGLQKTAKGDEVFFQEDGSFSVKLKAGGIVNYDTKGELINFNETGSAPWPPTTTEAEPTAPAESQTRQEKIYNLPLAQAYVGDMVIGPGMKPTKLLEVTEDLDGNPNYYIEIAGARVLITSKEADKYWIEISKKEQSARETKQQKEERGEKCKKGRKYLYGLEISETDFDMQSAFNKLYASLDNETPINEIKGLIINCVKERDLNIKQAKELSKILSMEVQFIAPETAPVASPETEAPEPAPITPESAPSAPESKPVEQAATALEVNTLQEQIVVGGIISYQGANYEVKELPSEQNGDRYILISFGGAISKLKKEQLMKIFEDGDAVLVPAEYKPESVVPPEPVLTKTETEGITYDFAKLSEVTKSIISEILQQARNHLADTEDVNDKENINRGIDQLTHNPLDFFEEELRQMLNATPKEIKEFEEQIKYCEIVIADLKKNNIGAKQPQGPAKKNETRVTPEGIKENYDERGLLMNREFPDGSYEQYDIHGTILLKKFSDGTEEYYAIDGKIKLRVFPDGTREGFDWDGSSLGRYRLDENGNRVDVPFNAPAPAPIITPAEAKDLTKLPRKEAFGKMADKLQKIGDKEIALRKLRETIASATQELAEIQRELAEIRANKKRGQEVGAKTPETRNFSAGLIENIISKMLQSFEKITEVKSVKVIGIGNKISLAIKIRAEEKEIGLKTVIEYRNGTFTAENPEIDAGMLTKVYLKSKIKPWLDKIEEVLKKEVEKQEGRKVKKVWFEDGQLKATL